MRLRSSPRSACFSAISGAATVCGRFFAACPVSRKGSGGEGSHCQLTAHYSAEAVKPGKGGVARPGKQIAVLRVSGLILIKVCETQSAYFIMIHSFRNEVLSWKRLPSV
jgi:hypothetical protein